MADMPNEWKVFKDLKPIEWFYRKSSHSLQGTPTRMLYLEGKKKGTIQHSEGKKASKLYLKDLKLPHASKLKRKKERRI